MERRSWGISSSLARPAMPILATVQLRRSIRSWRLDGSQDFGSADRKRMVLILSRSKRKSPDDMSSRAFDQSDLDRRIFDGRMFWSFLSRWDCHGVLSSPSVLPTEFDCWRRFQQGIQLSIVQLLRDRVAGQRRMAVLAVIRKARVACATTSFVSVDWKRLGCSTIELE